VQAQGDAEAVGKLEQWLQHGPRLAQVSRVDVVDIEPASSDTGFRIV